MKLFSKRYSQRELDLFSRSYRFRGHTGEEEELFLSESLRNRLQEAVKYIIKSNNFLESFLLVHDENKEEFFIEKSTLLDISQREIGYDLNEIINARSLTFQSPKYSDAKLFDLIELLFVFSRSEKRDDCIQLVQGILSEESSLFVIHGFMIFPKRASGLRSILPLMSDSLLKQKLSEYYNESGMSGSNDETRAKISAEILQNLFSSPKTKKDTKRHSETLCDKVSGKWTNKKHRKDLASLLSETVQNAKKLNNEIGNIRHTDQTTIPIDSPSFYKLISYKNMAIAELVILSLPEEYIVRQNADDLRDGYIKKYGVDTSARWVVRKKDEEIPTINLDDVPF